MLRNFWYACELSSAITTKPKAIKMLGLDFVLYRNSQEQVVALKDRCSHRGAALSLGKIEGDCLRCPYHGWKYTSDGVCLEIPANQPGVPIPKRACVQAYPVQEKYGWVWLFFGDLCQEKRPPLPPLPEFGEPTFRGVYVEFKWNAHYTRVLENQIDISHPPFTHANFMGGGMVDKREVEEYDVHLEEWGASATVTGKPPKRTRSPWKLVHQKQGSRPLRAKFSFYMPNASKIELEFPLGHFKIVLFSTHLPIDANTTVSKFIHLRNFITMPWADYQARKRLLRLFREDKPVVESQRPKVIPSDLAEELYVPSDALSIAYRQLRQKCLAQGWGINQSVSQSDSSNSPVA